MYVPATTDNNLPQSADYSVNIETGEATMSRRELARLLGVNHKTINNQVSTLQVSGDAPLSDFLVALVSTQLLINGAVKEFGFIEQLMQAGARAFIYMKAGVPLNTPANQKCLEPIVDIFEVEKSHISPENLRPVISVLDIHRFFVGKKIVFIPVLNQHIRSLAKRWPEEVAVTYGPEHEWYVSKHVYDTLTSVAGTIIADVLLRNENTFRAIATSAARRYNGE